MADRTFHQGDGFINIKRFWQIIKCALLIGADGGIQVRVSGHYDDRKHRMALLDLL
ncbi:hypothetical protein D3C76_1885810 [compost metagenome]